MKLSSSTALFPLLFTVASCLVTEENNDIHTIRGGVEDKEEANNLFNEKERNLRNYYSGQFYGSKGYNYSKSDKTDKGYSGNSYGSKGSKGYNYSKSDKSHPHDSFSEKSKKNEYSMYGGKGKGGKGYRRFGPGR